MLALDVTDPQSIRPVVEAAGPIDVLINNASIGLLSVFEGASMETTRTTFESNTFRAMAVIQAFLPQFRQRTAGGIVNVSWSVTRVASDAGCIHGQQGGTSMAQLHAEFTVRDGAV